MVAVAPCYEREKKLISLLTILNYYMFILFFMFKICNSYILFFNHNFACVWFTSMIKWIQGSTSVFSTKTIFIHLVIN